MEPNDVANRTYLYGLDEEYRVVRYTYVICKDLKIRDLRFQAMCLKSGYPSIRMIFAIDNSYSVHRAYQDTVNGRWPVAERALFKGLLETDGIRIL
ncbi:MAG TPA: hypothetical protein PKN45_10790 [Candidatus Limiplasma sp.]|nr:hypothetical protein [Candidatus Limiplasma sp.]